MKSAPAQEVPSVTKAARSAGFNGKNILRRVLLILCGVILGINVYLTNAQLVGGNQLPMPLGFGTAVVLSGSMEPTFSTGDLIVVTERDSVAVDDIVVYQQSGSLVVHRIVAIDGEYITTQGDANNTTDVPIHTSAIKGTVLFWIPMLGDVVTFVKSPVGTIALIVAAIALVEIPHLKEKEKDDEQREKLLEEIRRLKDEL